jgi:ubiquinol-cytochrome c reductase iron-sulfur subunit
MKIRRTIRLLVAVAALVSFLRTKTPVARRLLPWVPRRPRAETAAIVLFSLAGVASAGFIAVYALDRTPRQTQFLGLALGLALVCLAAAALVIGKRLVPQDEVDEEYAGPSSPDDVTEVVQLVEESAEALTRRRLLLLAAGGAGTAFAAALAVPALSLGPFLDADPLYRTPWRRGVLLVDTRGRPLRADRIEPDTFYTAYPAGANRRQIGAPLVVVRLDPSKLDLPADRKGWAPEGILAFSKICTHAGCAVALYRTPLFDATAPGPALVCPCHYSTFDPATGGTVVFGPAGRPLPQLPLEIGSGGGLRAGGGFSGPIGPSWWGVRMKDRST